MRRATRSPPKEKTEKASPAETDREGLLTSLSRLKPALRTGGAIPELSHLWFVEGHVSAYDGGLGIRMPLDLGFECGVPGRPLLGLLGTSSLKHVGLSVAAKDVALVVTLGRSRSKLNVLDVGRCPWNFPAQHEVTSRISEVGVEALRSVLVVKATAPSRIEHHGVFVYASKGTIDVYATDSRVIAQATYEDREARLPKFVFLPRPLAEQIVALCPHGADLTCVDDHFAAVGPGVEVCSNVLDTTGITDLPTLVDGKTAEHPDPVPLPTGLEAALDRAEVLAGTGEDAVVNLVVAGKKFRLSGKFASSSFELSEELELEEAHPDAEMRVDASVLRRGLLSSDAFSVTSGSLAFYGGDNFMYLVAART